MSSTLGGLLASQGCFAAQVALPATIQQRVGQRDWPALDAEIRTETLPGGSIFEALQSYGLANFSQIEFIISIRSSLEYPDEDGIWHDDGTRVLAFSLSLTLEPALVEGGRLEIRRRFTESATTAVFATPCFGEMIVFATGHQGFEHRITRVTAGERIIIAGWCT